MLKNKKSISIVGVIALSLLAVTSPAFSAGAKKQLTAPKSISVAFPNDTPTENVGVTWSPVAYNSGYTVRIYKSPNLTKPFITEQIATDENTKVFSFPYNNQYRVTVQTKGTGIYSTSPESGKYSFNTNFNAVITTQPAGAVNGVALTTQPVVKIAYPSGNTVTGFTGNVVATIASGTGTLSGTDTVAAVAGIATFTNLTITGTAGNFTLTFTPVGASAVTSNTFALTAGAAVSAVITTQPAGAVNGVALTTQPVVKIVDASDNTVTGFTGNVVATIASGTGTLSGTDTVAAVAGIATFTNLTITGTAGNFTLTFTPVGASAVTSNTFALTAGAAVSAVITTQPAGAVNGVALTTQPVVKIVDASDNTVTGFTGNVVATIASGTGTLSGTDTVAAVAGIATFTNLTITGTAGNFTLTFTPVGASAVTSNTFALTAGAAVSAVITTQPAGAVNGVALTTQPVVKIVDASDNTVTGFTGNVVATIASGTGTLSGTDTVAALAGIATFTNLTITGTAGNFTLTFTPVGASAVTSNTFALTD